MLGEDMSVRVSHTGGVLFLHIHLNRHSIYIKTEWEEYIVASHPLIPGYKINMRVMNCMSSMQFP